MELFLYFNKLEIKSDFKEQERIILQLASGNMDRKNFTCWLKTVTKKL